MSLMGRLKRSQLVGSIYKMCLIAYGTIRYRGRYKRDKREYIRQWQAQEKLGGCKLFEYVAAEQYPCYTDWVDEAGSKLDIHYFVQDMEMAKRIIKAKPAHHYDIGSRVDGFIAHILAASIPLTMIDIRPLGYDIEGLDFLQGDAMCLDSIESNTIESLSILHALEHFGLGRYGDPIDVDGWKKSLKAIQRVMKTGGTLYLSVPVGNTAKLCFNGHRVFTPMIIVSELDEMTLESFDYIHDYKIFSCDVNSSEQFLGDYDCGLFVFKKK